MHDVIIIGAGISGLSAGMYAGRFNLKTLVIGGQPGGIITTVDVIENYPGIKHIKGVEMAEVFLEHAKTFNAELKTETVQDVEKKKNGEFAVKTSKNTYTGKALIFATGTEHRKLKIPGEVEFSGKGVSYCALCDAAFFKGKTVCVVGGGDAAAIEALILAKLCKKVYMVVRKDKMRAEPINSERIKKSQNIEVRYLAELAEIFGDKIVKGAALKSGEKLVLDGIFIAAGHVPGSYLAKKLGVETDENGYIKVDINSQTNIEGVFAAGDVTNKPFKQAIIGAAEGVMAVYSAYQYIQKLAL